MSQVTRLLDEARNGDARAAGELLPLVVHFYAVAAEAMRRILVESARRKKRLNKRVKVWDPWTEREILDLRGHEAGCHGVAVSPGGERVASAGADGTIRIWDATSPRQNAGNEPLTTTHDSEVWSAAFTRDGKYVATGIKGSVLTIDN